MVILYYVICFVALSIVIKFIWYLLEPDNGQNGFGENPYPQYPSFPDLPESVVQSCEPVNDVSNKSIIQEMDIAENK